MFDDRDPIFADFIRKKHIQSISEEEGGLVADLLFSIGFHCDTVSDVRHAIDYLINFDWESKLSDLQPFEKKDRNCKKCGNVFKYKDHIPDKNNINIHRIVNDKHLEYCPECWTVVEKQDLIKREKERIQKSKRFCMLCGIEYKIDQWITDKNTGRFRLERQSHPGITDCLCESCENENKKFSRLPYLIKGQNNRAQKEGLQGDLTVREWITTLNHFDFSCAYCGGDYEVIEHFISVSRGGGTHRYNCVPACQKCNQIKRHYEPISLSNPIFDIERIKSIMRWLHISIDGDEQMQLPIAGD